MKKRQSIKNLTLIALVCSLLLPTLSCALAKAYQVEVVIFSQLSSKGLDSEQWPYIQTPTLDLSKSTTLAPYNPSQPNFTLLPSSKFTLTEAQKKIDKYHAYKTLLHVAWRQPTASFKKPISIHIFGGNVYNQDGQILNYNSSQSQQDLDNVWQINGTVSVSLNRYFDVNFNLFFAEPFSTLSTMTKNGYFKGNYSGPVYFHMLESRRTRSKTVNYIDHPLYGTLLMITPVGAS